MLHVKLMSLQGTIGTAMLRATGRKETMVMNVSTRIETAFPVKLPHLQDCIADMVDHDLEDAVPRTGYHFADEAHP